MVRCLSPPVKLFLEALPPFSSAFDAQPIFQPWHLFIMHKSAILREFEDEEISPTPVNASDCEAGTIYTGYPPGKSYGRHGEAKGVARVDTNLRGVQGKAS